MGYFSPREIKKKHSLVDALFNILHNNSIDLFSPPPPKVIFFLPLQVNVGERAVQRAVFAPPPPYTKKCLMQFKVFFFITTYINDVTMYSSFENTTYKDH